MGRRGFPQLLLVLALLLTTSSLTATEPVSSTARESSPTERPHYVSPRTVTGWLEEGRSVTFLDVREADEFAAAHLPEAINIHYSDVASMADRLPHDHPIVVYCIHSAHRAPLAAITLQKLGFENVSVLEGGIVAWQAEGMTILAAEAGKPPTILPKTERCDGAKQTL